MAFDFEEMTILMGTINIYFFLYKLITNEVLIALYVLIQTEIEGHFLTSRLITNTFYLKLILFNQMIYLLPLYPLNRILLKLYNLYEFIVLIFQSNFGRKHIIRIFLQKTYYQDTCASLVYIV